MSAPRRAAGLASLALALACAAPGPAGAQPAPDPKNRVSFQVERSREVANDWVTAIAGVTAEDSDAARLADRVNQTMRAALETAKAAKGVEVRSGGYRTHPVHGEKGRIERWSASQDLILESADVDALSALLGKLQGQLLLRSIEFSVSPEKRRETEDALIAEALAAYGQRAVAVQQALGARDHELVSLSIQTQGAAPPRPMLARQSMAMESVAPPAFESGHSTLAVHVDATIELER